MKSVLGIILCFFFLGALCENYDFYEKTVRCNETFALIVKQNYTVHISSDEYFNCYTDNCREESTLNVKWCIVESTKHDLCTVTITKSDKTDACKNGYEYFTIYFNLEQNNNLVYVILIIELVLIWFIATVFITNKIISTRNKNIDNTETTENV